MLKFLFYYFCTYGVFSVVIVNYLKFGYWLFECRLFVHRLFGILVIRMSIIQTFDIWLSIIRTLDIIRALIIRILVIQTSNIQTLDI